MKRKIVLFVITLLFTVVKIQAQCANVELYSQADVDNFAINYPGCTTVNGYIFIYDSGITSLNGLSQLTTVNGALYIYYTGVSDLSGLEQITSVNGELYIEGNNSLGSLDGLENLNSSGLTSITLQYNSNLSVCNQAFICNYLSNNGTVNITANSAGCNNMGDLYSGCGIDVSNLCFFGNAFFPDQASLDDFPLLYPDCETIVGNVYISGAGITDLSNLLQIKSISGQLQISNTSLLTLDGLQNLGNISSELVINSNTSLTSLQGLENLNSIGTSILISSNPVLTNINALSNVSGSLTDLSISGNLSLASLTGLEWLSAANNVTISGNSLLSDITTLSNLSAINSSLNINFNNNLSSLNGLQQLTSIGGSLYIGSNAVLSDISALNSLSSVGSIINLYANEQLALCDVSIICDWLDMSTGNLFINNNAQGCQTNQQVLNTCLGIPICTELVFPVNNSTDVSVLTPLIWNGVNDATGYILNIGTTPGGGEILADYDIGLNTTYDHGTPYLPYGSAVYVTITPYKGSVFAEDCTVHTFTTIELGNTCPDDLVITQQFQVDDFQLLYPGCSNIPGTLTIQGGNISNLSGLSSLNTVGKDLNINNTNVEDLSGLDNLSEVGLQLYISNNALMSSLEGFQSLNYVGFGLVIMNNSALLSLEHLGGISTFGVNAPPQVNVAGKLEIIGNNLLTDLTGLEGITEVNRLLLVRDNASLTTLYGLHNLTKVGSFLPVTSEDYGGSGWAGLGLDINSNPSLTNIIDLGNVTEVHYSLKVESNAALTSLNGLEGITDIKSSFGRITITANPMLVDLSGLDNLISIVYLTISGNSSLLSLDGLNALQTIGRTLHISYNHALNNILALENLSSLGVGVGSQLYIAYNSSLISLSGLEGLSAISGAVIILENNALSDLNGLNNVTTISGCSGCTFSGVMIAQNNNLSSLSGLENIQSIGGFLRISFNPVLTNITALSNLSGISGGLDISSNTILSDLSGLDHPMTIQGYLSINSNPALSVCHVEAICDYLQAPSGNITIWENKEGCNSREEVAFLCDPSVLTCVANVTPAQGQSVVLYQGTPQSLLTFRWRKSTVTGVTYDLMVGATPESAVQLASVQDTFYRITLEQAGTFFELQETYYWYVVPRYLGIEPADCHLNATAFQVSCYIPVANPFMMIYPEGEVIITFDALPNADLLVEYGPNTDWGTGFNAAAGNNILYPAYSLPVINVGDLGQNITGVPIGAQFRQQCPDGSFLNIQELLPAVPGACFGLSSPTNGATDVDVTTSIVINGPIFGGSSFLGYEISLGTTPGGTEILDKEFIGKTTTYVPAAPLPAGTTIYVSLRQIYDGYAVRGCQGLSFATLDACDESTWYRDADGDGYGDPNNSVLACDQPIGFVANNTDCDDSNPAYFQLVSFFIDLDGDYYHNGTGLACWGVLNPDDNGPPGYSGISYGEDCDDNDPAVNPGAAEICDGKDNNCNGLVDDGLAFVTYYLDADGDGYGDPESEGITLCYNPGAGYAPNNTDCDDSNPDYFQLVSFFIDQDGDYYHNGTGLACWGVLNPDDNGPPGYSGISYGEDCDDNDPAVNPGATEICDEKDNNCNGLVDDGLTLFIYYADADGDGYGDPNASVMACQQPDGYVTNSDDCDDTNPGYFNNCPPSNDNCNGAITLLVGSTCNFETFSSLNATASGGTNPTCGFYRGGDVWFTTVVPASGKLRVEVTNVAPYIAQFAIYTGSCGVLTQISCNQLDGEITFSDPILASETIFIRVYNYGSDQGGVFNICLFEPVVPENDNCENATMLTVGNVCSMVAYTNAYATAQPSSVAPQPSCGFFRGGDVWFAIIMPNSGRIRMEFINGGNIAQYALYSGSCGAFTEVLCSQLDSDKTLHNNSLAGQTLYLRVWNYNFEDGGTFQLCVWEPPLVSNDACANAISLDPGSACVFDTYTNAYATAEPVSVAPNPSCGFYRGGDVWFTFTMPETGVLTIQRTNTSGVNAQMALYAGTCGAMTEVACAQLQNTLNYANNGLAGQTMYLRVYNYNSEEGGTFNLCVFDPSCLVSISDVNSTPSSCSNNSDGTVTVTASCVNCIGQLEYSVNNGNDFQSSNVFTGLAPGLYNVVVRDNASITCSASGQNIVGSLANAVTYFIDADGDGYGNPGTSIVSCEQPAGYIITGGDCDDNDPGVYPGATEICDGKDNNCNGLIDEDIIPANNCQSCINGVYVDNSQTWYRDADGDGYGNPGESIVACEQPAGYVINSRDCDDTHPGINPDTEWYLDADGDGHIAANSSGFKQCQSPSSAYRFEGILSYADCDDNNPAVHPFAEEICGNGIDDNCNGTIDENALQYFADLDGDGFGDIFNSDFFCNDPGQGWVTNSDDCDDTNPVLNPNTVWYLDADDDGYTTGDAIVQCEAPGLTYKYEGILGAGDCNDFNAAIHPGAADDNCNGIDDNCNGLVDEDFVGGNDCQSCNNGIIVDTSPLWYRDFDGDGFGNPAVFVRSCTQPAGYVADNTDCNDFNSLQNPNTIWYQDADGDGYGNPEVFIVSCLDLAGYVSDNTDCDDSDPLINPGTIWYLDADGDGWYVDMVEQCFSPGSGYRNSGVFGGEDCDDSNPAVNPGATEIPGNGIDDNCNGEVDEGPVLLTFYRDADGDGFGDPNISIQAYEAPTGYVDNGNDCDDNNPSINPLADELCNGIDDNCNGIVDDNLVFLTWYEDADGDGYGNPDVFIVDCVQPAGYVLLSGDCDDTNPFVNPGRKEVADNGIDDNCDGQIDEGDADPCKKAPKQPGKVIGPAVRICDNTPTVYSVNPVSGATSYLWTVQHDAVIIAGQGTNTVTVTFPPPASQQYVELLKVYALNSCGISPPRPFNIRSTNAAPARPAKIVGPASVCGGETATYTTVAVPGANQYNWSVSNGASILEGQGTNIIQVLIPLSFNTLNVGVSAANDCGVSAARIQKVTACKYARMAGEEMVLPASKGLDIRVAPNPVRDMLRIELVNSDELTDGMLRLFDMQGRQVRQLELQLNNSSQIMIDMSSMPVGLYLLEVTSGSHRQTIKVAKAE